MSRQSAPICLSAEERSELERLIRSHSAPQQLALRARMIVLAADGVGVCETAQRLGVWRKGVSLWRARWLAGGSGETATDRLQDAPRSGDVAADGGVHWARADCAKLSSFGRTSSLDRPLDSGA